MRSSTGGSCASVEVVGKKSAPAGSVAAFSALASNCSVALKRCWGRPVDVVGAGASGADASRAADTPAAGSGADAAVPSASESPPPASYAAGPAPRASTIRSTSSFDSASILMNLMPIPAGSPLAPSSRRQTTRPTPWMSRDSSFSWNSNFSSVPMDIGSFCLMKIPPREMSMLYCSMNSSTVALL